MRETRPRHEIDLSFPPDRVPAIPDWSVVMAANAKLALTAVYAAGKWDRRRSGLDPVSSRILAAVLRHYAELGAPPMSARLAAALGIAPREIEESLHRLAQHDLLLLDRDTGTIEGAYPFTEKATGHSVTFRRTGRSVSTMCAIDALGVGAMCREDVTIHSACGLCGTPITGQVEQRGMALGVFGPPDTVVWAGLRESCGCAADTLCTELLFFCGNAHLEEWRSGRTGAGYRLSPEEAFQVGKALFIDRAMMGAEPSEGTP